MSLIVNDLILLPTIEFMTEGGAAFGPSSFDGYPLLAGFTLRRAASHPPTKEQEERMKLPPDHKDALGAGYAIALWAKFQVTKPLDPPDWESPDMTFEHYWSLGGKSAQTHYVADLPDLGVPKGLKGGFKELETLAQGVFDLPNGSKAVITLGEEPGGKFRDLSEFVGPWYQPQPGISDAKKKLYTNSGFMQFLILSAAAIAAVDPSMVVTKTEKNAKTGLDETIMQLKIWPSSNEDPGARGPDGRALCARFFPGLNGRWDTAKSTVAGRNRSFEQKVLYLTGYEGRVMVSQTASAQVQAQAPVQAPTGAQMPVQAQAAPSPAPTPSPASAPVQGPASAPAGGDPASTPGDLDSILTSLILEVLPSDPLGDGSGRYKGETLTQLGLKVAKLGNERKVFGSSPNMLEVTKAIGILVRSTPTPEDAAMAAAMGEKVAFAFNPVQSIVERVG